MLVRLRQIETFPSALEPERDNDHDQTVPPSERRIKRNTLTSFRHAQHPAAVDLPSILKMPESSSLATKVLFTFLLVHRRCYTTERAACALGLWQTQCWFAPSRREASEPALFTSVFTVAQQQHEVKPLARVRVHKCSRDAPHMQKTNKPAR